MEWRERDGVRWLQADLPGATAVFATRTAGSLKDGHERVSAALGIDPERIVSGRQVHGTELAFHDAAAGDTGEVDGHVLRSPGPVGLIYTADCLPVALAGPGGGAILHCGWRGLATSGRNFRSMGEETTTAGLVGDAVAAIGATHAAIGPGIGPCCYEVGEEVLEAFAPLGAGIASGRMLDLAEAARRLLRAAGVERIESSDLCTSCEEGLFFSHRRDGGPGRQGGLVWLDREGG